MSRVIRSFLAILVVVAIPGFWCRTSFADMAILTPAKDNTLYEDSLGSTSNGSGQYIFAGHTSSNLARRALLEFDLTGIPAGSTVTRAVLTLSLSMSIAGDQLLSLHRVGDSWGEGASDASGQEGQGAPAAAGDATWLHRVYNTTSWATPGGDFEGTPSATIVVSDAFGPWSWGSPGTASDVQSWVDDPPRNHGWIVVGNESAFSTAKRFGSRENPVAAERPVLMVEFTPPAPPGAGMVAESGLDALRLARVTGGDVRLSWGGSSCATDPDFEVYEGALRTPASHVPVLCSTFGATSVTITPAPGNSYYLTVPRSAAYEGSYGTQTGASERPPSASACLPQTIRTCQ